MFIELVTDVATQINANGEYSVEFACDGVYMLALVRFWQRDELFRVFLKRTGRLQGQTDAEICLISYIMGAISTSPKLISCTGCSMRTIQLLDLSPYSSFSVQSPPRFEELSLPQLMHRKSQSVFGRLDFFSTLRYLVISLGGCLELGWALLSPELSKVRNVQNEVFSCANTTYSQVVMWSFIPKLMSNALLDVVSSRTSLTFQAIRTCQLDICGLPNLYRGLLDNWSKVHSYLSKHALFQEMQGVRKQVTISFHLLL